VFERLNVSMMAHALAGHASSRQTAIAQNVAHADTPDYLARDLPSFADIWQAGGGTSMRATRAGHIGQLAPGAMPAAEADRTPGTRSPNGNTVSLEREMVKAAEVRQQFEMALAIASSASNIQRTALGRGK
jgi:flagellar basal-body rod protein FlgB